MSAHRATRLLAAIASLAVACGAPPYAFDASLRTDARCDFCGDAGVCLDFATDPLNCGGCMNTCMPPANGRATCDRGFCGFECSGDFADCDGMRGNGCEADLSGSTQNCGGCGNACTARSGLGVVPNCDQRACREVCAPGRGNCDGDLPTNGCETDLTTSMAFCGACTTPCSTPANGTATCTAGRCMPMCNAGFRDCDGDASSPCDTNVMTSGANCGSCGNACQTGTQCVSGMCRVM